MASSMSDLANKTGREPRSRDELERTVSHQAVERVTVPAVRGAADESSERRVHLVVLAGATVGQVFTLRQGSNAIGRDDAAEIQVMDAGISRRHALIFFDPSTGEYCVRDTGSRNGTSVNGEPVREPRALVRGDKIEIGLQTVLRVSFSDEAETRYARQMYDAVLRDALTGAFNRRYLEDRLAAEVAFARRHKTGLSLLMLDIDHFKRINDTHGHPVGDAVLRWLADRVMVTIRTEDVLARYGGEEFAILCRDTHESDAAVLAERVRAALAERPYGTSESQAREDGDLKTEDLSGHIALANQGVAELEVTVSIGVADLISAQTFDAKVLVDSADKALYAAKESGRNRCVRFSAL